MDNFKKTPEMKKSHLKMYIALLLCGIELILLVSCKANSSEDYSLQKTEDPPAEVKENIKHSRLELIYDKDHIPYIIFQGGKNTKAEINENGDSLEINFIQSAEEQDVGVLHVYKLKKKPKFERLNIFVDGEPTGFDSITG